MAFKHCSHSAAIDSRQIQFAWLICCLTCDSQAIRACLGELRLLHLFCTRYCASIFQIVQSPMVELI